jgi:serine phosphatase RsbU (regulator of sigma subunit)
MKTIAPPFELLTLEKLREEELEEARAIQSMMMPAESLRSGGVMISHAFQPIAAVGGDFLDYFVLTDGTVGLYLGDVSGKGLPAALYAALAVGALRGVHKTGTSPHDVLGTLNRRLMIRGMPRRHAAMQYGVFDPRTHELQVTSAGMPGPFYLCANGCRSLELTGMPPGLFANSSYETLTLRLQPGEIRCSSARTESRRHSIAMGINLELSGCKSFAMLIGALHPPNCWDGFSPQPRVSRAGGSSMTIWRRHYFISPAE